MLTDMLNAIYGRIAQLGQAVQGLKESLDGLNTNIEDKIKNLTSQFSDLKVQIDIGGETHIQSLVGIGAKVTEEISKLQNKIGIEAIGKLTQDLATFSNIAEHTLKQENVDLLIKEALDSINQFKEQKLTTGKKQEGGEESG